MPTPSEINPMPTEVNPASGSQDPSAREPVREPACEPQDPAILPPPPPKPQPSSPQAPLPQPGSPPILQLVDAAKAYGRTRALDNVTLSVPRGRIVGLIGPNGSGKSTLIKMAAGLVHPTAGTVLVDGRPPSAETKAIVSYLPERPYFSSHTKVSEALQLFSDFYRDFDQSAAIDMLRRFEIAPDTSFSQMSKGTREKVQLVLVMARHAALYLLDEPLGGVDPASRSFILDTIVARYRREATVIVSTHLVADVEAILDDFILVSYGKLVAYAPVSSVRELYGMSLDEYFRGVFAC